MWVFMSNAFLSIVEHRAKYDYLLVRARAEGDIERVFPDATVTKTPAADYLFRAVIPRQEVAAAMAAQVEAIAYDNFKNSVAEDDRHRAYFGAWAAMNDFQRRRAGEDEDHY